MNYISTGLCSSCVGSHSANEGYVHMKMHDGTMMGAIDNNNDKRRKETGTVRFEVLKLAGSEVHSCSCPS